MLRDSKAVSNQRTPDRVAVRLDVCILRGRDDILGLTEDLGLDGAMIRLQRAQPVAAGDRVRLSFVLPDLSSTVEVIAVVHWVDGPVPQRIGVRFSSGFRDREAWALGQLLERARPMVPPENPIRVLVIDDDPDIRTIFERVLHHRGCRVRSLERVDDLTTELGAWNADVVIIDAGCIPRSLVCVNHEPPIIVMSGMAESELRDLARKVGATDAVRKPMAIEELLGAIRRTIDPSGARL